MGLFQCQYCKESTDSLVNHSCPQKLGAVEGSTESKDYVFYGQPETATVRKFNSGATRNTDTGKFDYYTFFSPEVLERRAAYMHKHRMQPDGALREGGNWKKGIPTSAYMASLYRHFVDIWKEYCGVKTSEGQEEAICAAMFNLEGMLYEILKAKQNSQKVALRPGAIVSCD